MCFRCRPATEGRLQPIPIHVVVLNALLAHLLASGREAPRQVGEDGERCRFAPVAIVEHGVVDDALCPAASQEVAARQREGDTALREGVTRT